MGQVQGFTKNERGYYNINMIESDMTQNSTLNVDLNNVSVPYTEYIKGDFFRIKCENPKTLIFFFQQPFYNFKVSDAQVLQYNSNEPSYIFIHKNDTKALKQLLDSNFLAMMYYVDRLKKDIPALQSMQSISTETAVDTTSVPIVTFPITTAPPLFTLPPVPSDYYIEMEPCVKDYEHICQPRLPKCNVTTTDSNGKKMYYYDKDGSATLKSIGNSLGKASITSMMSICISFCISVTIALMFSYKNNKLTNTKYSFGTIILGIILLCILSSIINSIKELMTIPDIKYDTNCIPFNS